MQFNCESLLHALKDFKAELKLSHFMEFQAFTF